MQDRDISRLLRRHFKAAAQPRASPPSLIPSPVHWETWHQVRGPDATEDACVRDPAAEAGTWDSRTAQPPTPTVAIMPRSAPSVCPSERRARAHRWRTPTRVAPEGRDALRLEATGVWAVPVPHVQVKLEYDTTRASEERCDPWEDATDIAAVYAWPEPRDTSGIESPRHEAASALVQMHGTTEGC